VLRVWFFFCFFGLEVFKHKSAPPLLTTNAENILLVSAKPSQDGEGIILHLRETDGKPTDLSVVLPFKNSQRRSLTEVNVIEEVIGEPGESVHINPWESKFVKLNIH